jgi:hypothetical protein
VSLCCVSHFIVMLSVIMLKVFMLSVFMLNVIILSVIAVSVALRKNSVLRCDDTYNGQ